MESFAALFEESLQRQEMRAGEVITAEIVRIDQNFVVVNAGLKSESMIPVEEFQNERGEVDAQRVANYLTPHFAGRPVAEDPATAIRTWGGRVYYCEEPRLVDGRWRTFEYKLLNYLIQGSAARQTKIAMRNMWREGITPLIQMHDEVGASVASEATVLRIAELMRDAVPTVVPMVVDSEVGPSWGDAKYSWTDAQRRWAA